MNLYDPQLCYILDGFLGLYGLIITGMFIKEKVSHTHTHIYTYTHIPVLLPRGDPDGGPAFLKGLET